MKQKNDDILNLFQTRYTCKGYDPEKRVSDEDFMTIMEVARLSPSSMGFEPWKFVLLNNNDIKEKIRPYAWGAEHSMKGASHFVLILARNAKDVRYDSEYVEYILKEIQHLPDDFRAETKERIKSFQKNDMKILDNDRAAVDWACKQTYVPLTNMLTAAAMLGVNATPIEGFNREKVESILIEEGIIDPEHFGISCMIAFGYKNKVHRPKTRRKMEEVFEVVD